MTRIKRVHLPAAFLSLTPEDRGVMERAASIMNIPLTQVTQLIPGPSTVDQGTSQRTGSLGTAQGVVGDSHDVENGTFLPKTQITFGQGSSCSYV